MSGHTVQKRLEADRALTAREVTDLLNIAPRTLYRLVERGELRAFKVGRDYRFWPDEVERFASPPETNPEPEAGHES